MGFPPPDGSKKDVERFRSVRSMVIAPAKTGSDTMRRKAVIPTAQMKRGSFEVVIAVVGRPWMIVVMKLIDPRIDEAPAI